MSKVIDERVVSMQFDNKRFESNVAKTMSTIDKLKEKLNFTGSARGLENISNAAKNVNMSSLGASVDTVKAKFSALQIMGVTALTNITNSAVNAAKRIVRSLTIEPVRDGFKEYEMMLNTIQTTMAATGKTAKEVEDELKKLDEYADKTVYSTADMMNNLPKFTNAGVDLAKATKAMIGIANATALAGGDASKASIAFYNLGQAIGTGYLTRMDYNSINNAGIATMEWKNQMVDAAIAAGTLKKVGEDAYKAGGKTFTLQQLFIDGLQKQWATTEVMMKVFGDYGDETTEIGKKSYAAAQDIKTFTQMMESLKATAGTGWKDTWQIIFGDLDGAKKLWTGLTNFLSNIITKMTKLRNDVLNSAFSKGFKKLGDKINDIIKPVNKTVDTVKGAVKTLKSYTEIVDEIIAGKWGNGKSRWDKLTDSGYDWAHAQNLVNEKLGVSLRRTTKYKENQNELAKSQTELTKTEAERIAQLAKMSDAQLKALGYSDKQIQAFRELKDAADKVGLPLEEFLTKLDEIDGKWLFTNSFKNIGNAISQFASVIGKAWSSIFPNSLDSISTTLFNIITAFHRFTASLGGFVDESGKLTDKGDKLRRTFEGIFAAIDIVATITAGPLRIAFKVLKAFLGIFDLDILSVTAAIGDVIVKFRDWLDSILNFNKVFEKIAPYMKKVADGIKLGASAIWDAIVHVGKIIKDGFKSFTQSKFVTFGKDIVQGLINGIRNGASSLWDTIVNFAKSIIDKFCKVLGINSPSKVFFTIGGFIVAGLLAGLKDKFSSVVDFFSGLAENIVDIFKNFDWNQISALMRTIASFIPGLPILNIFANLANLAHVAGDNLIDAFRNIGGNIADGLANGIEGGVGGIWAAIVTFAKGIIQKVCDIFGIASPSKVMMAIGGYLVLGLILGLKNEASSLWDILKNGGSKCIEIIQIFGEKILEMVKKLDLGTVISVGLTSGFLITFYKVAKIVEKFASPLESIGGLFKTVKDTIADLGKAIKTNIKVKTVRIVSQAILDLAIAIAILAASMFVISKIDSDRLWPAFGAIAALTGLVAGLIGVVGLLMFFANKIDGFDGFSKIAVTVLSVASSLLVIALAVKLLAGLNADQMQTACITLGAMVAGLSIVILALSRLGKVGRVKDMTKIGSMLLGVSAALLLMVAVVKLASKLTPKEAFKGLAFVLAVEILFISLVKVSQYAGANAIKAGGMILLMAVAFMAMIRIIKSASKLQASEVLRGMGVIALVGAMFIALIAVSNLAGQHAAKAGVMLLGMAAALGAIVLVIEKAAGLSESDVKKGIKIIGVLGGLFIAIIAVSKLAGEHAAKAGIMLISMAGALFVITGVLFLLSLMDPKSVYKALGVVTVLEVLFMGLVAVTYLAKDVKTGPLVMLTIAVAILSGVLIALSVIDPSGLKGATIALSSIMAALAILVASTKYASSIKPAAFVSLLGVIVMVSAIVWALTELDVSTSVTNAIALGVLITAMAAALMMMGRAKNISTSAMGAMFGLTAVIAGLALILTYFSNMPPASALLPNVIALGVLLNAMAASLLILDYVRSVSVSAIGAMAGLTVITAGLAVILSYMSTMPSATSSIPNAVALGVLVNALSTAVLILSKVGPGVTAANAAIIPMVKLMAALTAVVIALGAIYQIPYVDKILSDGGQALASIGTAIGNFIGGIGKGIATTFMSGLPEIGTYLSSFMENIKPFIEGAKTIDADVMSGIKSLAQTILILTKADVLNGLTSRFTGDNGLEEFGSQLPSLATSLNNFATNLGTFDESKVQSITCAANAIKAIAEAAAVIPNEGGWAAKIFGDNGIGAFGDKLPQLGSDLNAFATNLDGFDNSKKSAITCAANAIKAIAEAAKTIPNEGGWAAAIFGDNGIASFGDKLPKLGSDLNAFATNLGTFDEAKVATIQCASNAIKVMAQAATGIDGQAEWSKKLFGDNGLASFGTQLASVGTNLKNFATNLGTFDEAKVATVRSAVNAIKAFTSLANADLKGAKKQLPGFGDKLPGLATDIKAFCDNMPASETLTAATTNLKNMLSALNDIATSSSVISNFSKSMKNLGKTGVDSFAKSFSSDSAKSDVTSAAKSMMDNLAKGIEAKMTNIKSAGEKAAAKAIDGFDTQKDDAESAGKDLGAGLVKGINAKQDAVYWAGYKLGQKAVQGEKDGQASNSPSKLTIKAGKWLGEGLIIGMAQMGNKVYKAGSNLGEAATGTISGTVSRIADAINSDMDVQPTIRPVLDLSDISSNADAISSMFNAQPSVGLMANVNSVNRMMSRRQNGANDDVVSAIGDLKKSIHDNPSNVYNFGDVAYGDESAVSNAVQALVRAIMVERRV